MSYRWQRDPVVAEHAPAGEPWSWRSFTAGLWTALVVVTAALAVTVRVLP